MQPSVRSGCRLVGGVRSFQLAWSTEARQALEAGLVDRIGFLEEAIDRAVELAGLSPETARAVKYSKPKGLLDEVLGGASATSRVDLAAIAELTTPRGWYLCSWLPALVQSE